MLQLPACSQGFMVSKCLRSRCRAMLVAPSRLLKTILLSLDADSHHIETHMTLPKDLVTDVSTLLRLVEDKAYGRAFACAMYNLDRALEGLIGFSHDIWLVVQVVTVTSPEFRDIFSQSIRELQACLSTKIALDTAAGTLNVPTVFGSIKKFPIELDSLLSDPQALRQQDQIELPYVRVVLMVFKACLKSTFLKTSLGSDPLFEEAFRTNEILEVV